MKLILGNRYGPVTLTDTGPRTGLYHYFFVPDFPTAAVRLSSFWFFRDADFQCDVIDDSEKESEIDNAHLFCDN